MASKEGCKTWHGGLWSKAAPSSPASAEGPIVPEREDLHLLNGSKQGVVPKGQFRFGVQSLLWLVQSQLCDVYVTVFSCCQYPITTRTIDVYSCCHRYCSNINPKQRTRHCPFTWSYYLKCFASDSLLVGAFLRHSCSCKYQSQPVNQKLILHALHLHADECNPHSDLRKRTLRMRAESKHYLNW